MHKDLIKLLLNRWYDIEFDLVERGFTAEDIKIALDDGVNNDDAHLAWLESASNDEIHTWLDSIKQH